MTRSSIMTELQPLDTIRAVLDWAFSQTPPAEVIDAIAQDETTHDVIVLVRPETYLAFDVTWLGHVRSVTEWDHAPGPEELLARRVSKGWLPTPTPTQRGAVILGYAAVLDGALA
jgi:hypothetical protein